MFCFVVSFTMVLLFATTITEGMNGNEDNVDSE